MKSKLKNKKTFAGLLTFAGVFTIALFFSIFTILGGKHVDAAENTCQLKVHYLDVAGDSTLIKYRDDNGVVHYGMIDAGDETTFSKSAANYFAGIADNANNSRTLDFCVITHAHADHYKGLQYFDDFKKNNRGNNIHVKTMYVNGCYSDHGNLTPILGELVKEGLIDQIVYLGYESVTHNSEPSFNVKKNEIFGWANTRSLGAHYVYDIEEDNKYSGGFSFKILSPALNEDKNGVGAGQINARSLMCVLDYDNNKDKVVDYKYIFMGDVNDAAPDKNANGLTAITENSLYFNNLVPTSSSTKIIYKIGHHGRRNDNNYFKSAENAMYKYISMSKEYRSNPTMYKKNEIYCVANEYYGDYSTKTTEYKKFAKSSEKLLDNWASKGKVVHMFFNNGKQIYGNSNSSLEKYKTETVNGIKALTSTKSLGFN